MVSEICHAIKNQLLIEFHYHGGKRTVEPYIHGRNTRGKVVLSAYQLHGYSRSNTPQGWKTFKLHEISHLKLTPQTFFRLRTDYNRKDQHFRSIHCQI